MFLGLLVFCSVVITIVYVLGLATHSKAQQTTEPQELARVFRSKIQGNKWNGFQWFEFKRAGYSVHVRVDTPETRSSMKVSMVQVRIPWIDTTSRMNIYPETVPDKLKKFLGMEDIVIDSPQFDQEFIIQGNASELKELLKPDVQLAITSISNKSMTRNLHISIVDGGFYVRKRVRQQHILTDATDVINSAGRLHDLLLAAAREVSGVTFIEPELINAELVKDVQEVQPMGFIMRTHPLCMVCGDDIERQKVRCKSCRTPHHRECWEYIGQCSVYGCGQRKFSS